MFNESTIYTAVIYTIINPVPVDAFLLPKKYNIKINKI
jgi:hypothetical protein